MEDNVDSKRLHARIHLSTRVALFSAIAVVNGYLLISIPNVELISLTIALSGWILGRIPGFLVGIIGMGLFGILNVMGLPYPPVWIAQITGMALIGLTFGNLSHFLFHLTRLKQAIVCGISGFILTLFYDILTNLAFPIAIGAEMSTWATYLIAGIPFAVTHLVSNTLLFIFVLPVAHRRLSKLFI